MINIDLENKVFNFNTDKLNIFSAQVQYIISFFYCLLFKRGYDPSEAKDFIEEVVKKGLTCGIETCIDMLKEQEQYELDVGQIYNRKNDCE